MNKSISLSISQSVSQAVGQSVSQPVSQSVSQTVKSVSQSVSQLVSCSVSQPISSQSVSQSVSLSVSQSVCQSVSQSINHRFSIGEDLSNVFAKREVKHFSLGNELVHCPLRPTGSVTRSQHCVSSGHFCRCRNSCWDIDVLDSRDGLLTNAPNHRGNRSG